jgi:DNA-damage-inducible protein D
MNDKHIVSKHHATFESIRQTAEEGNEAWSSRDFARILDYTDYRHFERVIEKAKIACSNSGQDPEDHFVDTDDMVEIGSGAQRAIKSILMSRYAYRQGSSQAGGADPDHPPQRHCHPLDGHPGTSGE